MIIYYFSSGITELTEFWVNYERKIKQNRF